LQQQARQEEVREHLEEVWVIDDVPRFGHMALGGDPAGSMDSMITAFKYMGIGNDDRQMLALIMDEKGVEKTFRK
jgi:hypothetical protein